MAVKVVPSPNHGLRKAGADPALPMPRPSLIILHYTGMESGVAALQLLTNPLSEVSCHYLVWEDGRIFQLVPEAARAWHAGVSRYRGRDNCNDDSIGVELEGLEGGLFEPMQYQSLQTLAQAVRARYPVRYVAGHEHIAPERKADPGPGFDWTVLREAPSFAGLQFPHQIDCS
ncbi:MAG: 1,6-anhydro-N-acetylmuramyl-L-alanine amidase AmpD [Betaproteobacteria bacterium]|nr:1,6-anhydro-N-acetylmuramyl-L-alanine amidase AmpD [Betaproteobacteria bacterium]